MKSKIVITIIVIILLVSGLFLPTRSGVTDAAQPEENPITAFRDAAEVEKAEEEARAEEEAQAEQDEMISELSQPEQTAYAWAALRADPESILMTPDRISEYNTSLQDTTGVVDILSVPDMTEEDVKALIRGDQAEFSSLEGVTRSMFNNQNLDGSFKNVRLGIVLTRSALCVMPDEEAPSLLTLSGTSPIWVLHNSTDSQWFYVQSAYGRGWVRSSDIAITSSEDVWLSYVAPENRVVVSSSEVTIEGRVFDMGAVFSCLEENSDTYTILLPTRRNDGSLDATSIEVDREAVSFGYIDYSWTHLYRQLFRYYGKVTDLSTLEMIVNVYRTFNITLPNDLDADFEALGAVVELESLSEDEQNIALGSVEAPALIQDDNGISVLLGQKDGLWTGFQITEGVADEVTISNPVRMVVIG